MNIEQVSSIDDALRYYNDHGSITPEEWLYMCQHAIPEKDRDRFIKMSNKWKTKEWNFNDETGEPSAADNR